MHGVPAWMLNPALGGLNPLPIRPSLKQTKRVRRSESTAHPWSGNNPALEQAQAVMMVQNEQKFLHRGSVAGRKLSPLKSYHQLRSHGVRHLRAQSVEPGYPPSNPHPSLFTAFTCVRR